MTSVLLNILKYGLIVSFLYPVCYDRLLNFFVVYCTIALYIQGVPEYMTQFQNFIKNKTSKDSTKTQIFSERL